MAEVGDNKNPKKGVAGKNTGSSTRNAIQAAINRGCTQEQIGNESGRSSSVISAILNGTIENPPADLAQRIRTACKRVKPSLMKK
jgi:transcriptional regulator with XRE-family HTH domain